MELELTGTNTLLVIIVLAIALGALAMAVVFRKQVLAAGEGTDNMKTIALAVQEGANAYLTRQFRTLGIFAVIAFFALLVLPADDTTVRIFRSVFFLVGRRLLLRGRLPRHEPRRARQPPGGGRRRRASDASPP